MILVTGAAGFIGSNIVASLNEIGRSDLVLCDQLGADGRWRNLATATFQDFVGINDLGQWLAGTTKLSAVIHMGAVSNTDVTDGDAVIFRNFKIPLLLLDYCSHRSIPFLYASSAAVYGDDERCEDSAAPAAIAALRPLNLYGWSKRQFDYVVASRAALGAKMPSQWVGFRFFNVFGPNEYHKGEMRSIVTKIYPSIIRGETATLFKSHRKGIGHGEQRRDFIYVKDVVRVVLWFLQHHDKKGIFNIGTGRSRSFNALVGAVCAAAGRESQTEYVDMPEDLRARYQYHTEASLANLRAAGHLDDFMSLEDGVADYICCYLSQPNIYRTTVIR